MHSQTFIFLFLMCLIILILIAFTVSFAERMILMAKRKDTPTMLAELRDNFSTDYNYYQHLPSEDVTITSDDHLKLKGVYHNIYPHSKKVVLINHGYTANRYVGYQFSDIFFEEGYNVLLIDMRSHGESEGTYASYGYNESKDIASWVKWLKQKIGHDAFIGLHGQSMGAATVMLYAGTHPESIRFVIEDCGFTTAREAIHFQFKQAHIPFWPLYDLVRIKTKKGYAFDLNDVSAAKAITNSSIPTLFIHGMDDRIVPPWMAETLYKHKQGPKDMLYLVPGADHMQSYVTNKPKYKEIVQTFLNSIE